MGDRKCASADRSSRRTESSKHDNIQLAAKSGDGEILDTEDFSVLWVGSISVPLDSSADPEALARYLAGPLADMRYPPNPKGEKSLEVYLLSSVADEARQLSEQLELPLG